MLRKLTRTFLIAATFLWFVHANRNDSTFRCAYALAPVRATVLRMSRRMIEMLHKMVRTNRFLEKAFTKMNSKETTGGSNDIAIKPMSREFCQFIRNPKISPNTAYYNMGDPFSIIKCRESFRTLFHDLRENIRITVLDSGIFESGFYDLKHRELSLNETLYGCKKADELCRILGKIIKKIRSYDKDNLKNYFVKRKKHYQSSIHEWMSKKNSKEWERIHGSSGYENLNHSLSENMGDIHILTARILNIEDNNKLKDETKEDVIRKVKRSKVYDCISYNIEDICYIWTSDYFECKIETIIIFLEADEDIILSSYIFEWEEKFKVFTEYILIRMKQMVLLVMAENFMETIHRKFKENTDTRISETQMMDLIDKISLIDLENDAIRGITASCDPGQLDPASILNLYCQDIDKWIQSAYATAFEEVLKDCENEDIKIPKEDIESLFSEELFTNLGYGVLERYLSNVMLLKKIKRSKVEKIRAKASAPVFILNYHEDFFFPALVALKALKLCRNMLCQ